MAALAEAIEVHARARPLCLFLDEGAASESLAAFVAGAAPTGRTLLVVPMRAPIGRPFAAEIALPPLTPAEIRELVAAGVDEEPPAAALAAVTETSRGNAALATLLARRLIANLRAGDALGAHRRERRPGRSFEGQPGLAGERNAAPVAGGRARR